MLSALCRRFVDELSAFCRVSFFAVGMLSADCRQIVDRHLGCRHIVGVLSALCRHFVGTLSTLCLLSALCQHFVGALTALCRYFGLSALCRHFGSKCRPFSCRQVVDALSAVCRRFAHFFMTLIFFDFACAL